MCKGMKPQAQPENQMMRSLLIDGQRHMLPEMRYEDPDPVLEELRRMTEGFRTAYKGSCLIPSLPHEENHDA